MVDQSLECLIEAKRCQKIHAPVKDDQRLDFAGDLLAAIALVFPTRFGKRFQLLKRLRLFLFLTLFVFLLDQLVHYLFWWSEAAASTKKEK